VRPIRTSTPSSGTRASKSAARPRLRAGNGAEALAAFRRHPPPAPPRLRAARSPAGTRGEDGTRARCAGLAEGPAHPPPVARAASQLRTPARCHAGEGRRRAARAADPQAASPRHPRTGPDLYRPITGLQGDAIPPNPALHPPRLRAPRSPAGSARRRAMPTRWQPGAPGPGQCMSLHAEPPTPIAGIDARQATIADEPRQLSRRAHLPQRRCHRATHTKTL
jgi:hypothetical protein